ncbi:hypothetical protein M5K25_005479 [Dendrobium thyrsiflorum]|uniref:Uncharacterized protein n=1 Tax=Dendrobium thyrsiflorum TaxID=117978 RepID=A0ABD0VHM3_DENTH
MSEGSGVGFLAHGQRKGGVGWPVGGGLGKGTGDWPVVMGEIMNRWLERREGEIWRLVGGDSRPTARKEKGWEEIKIRNKRATNPDTSKDNCAVCKADTCGATALYSAAACSNLYGTQTIGVYGRIRLWKAVSVLQMLEKQMGPDSFRKILQVIVERAPDPCHLTRALSTKEISFDSMPLVVYLNGNVTERSLRDSAVEE